MTLKKCDRCGDTYKLGEQECGVLVVHVHNSNHSSWSGGDTYDFCPKCMKAIEKIITGELNNA